MEPRKTDHHLRRAALACALGLGLLAASAAIAASGADEGLPGDWLSRYASPRAAGLGGATVGVGGEPQAALWNPAGLAWLRRNTVQATTARLFDDTSVSGLAFAAPGGRLPTFGLNLLYLKSGEFERTNELNQTLGSFDEGDMVLAASAAHNLADRIAVGANVKLVRQSVEEFSGGGVGFDLGLMAEPVPGVKVGAAALNLGGPTITLREKDETWVEEYRGGVSVAVLEGAGLVAAEAVHREGPGTDLRLGGEFRVGDLALRLGWHIENVAAGFGYRFDNGLSVDYGMTDHELGMIHRFGVNYVFGGFYADSDASPAVFSPMGANPVTKFLLTANTKTDVVDWELVISDRSAQVVRSYAGQGQPPAHIVWDGKDRAGLPLPDGAYTYRLRVVERDGRVTHGRTRTVEIATGGPRGSIGVQ